jgi:lipid A 4'-phosphatase
MSRTGLVVTLIVAAIVGLVFGLYPQFDLAIARLFYDPAPRDFAWRLDPTLSFLRDESMWVVTALVAPAAVALLVKLLFPFTRMLMSARAALFLVATLILGPGLVVNVALKDHWSRPRPIHVAEFGGSERFVPWWDPAPATGIAPTWRAKARARSGPWRRQRSRHPTGGQSPMRQRLPSALASARCA